MGNLKLHNLVKSICIGECGHNLDDSEKNSFYNTNNIHKNKSKCSIHSHNHRKEHLHCGHKHNSEGEHTHSKAKHNINIQAAMIHIIGDIIQSIGVIVAAILVYFFNYAIIDPITTIIFAIIVIFTTIPIVKQCISVIMHGTPQDINIDHVKNEILKVKLF